MLVALATEHAYLVFRGGVRWALHRFVWHESDAERQIRRSALELRRGYLDEMGLKKPPAELAKMSKRDDARGDRGDGQVDEEAPRVDAIPEHAFWKRDDLGLSELRRRKEKSD